jgi:hypothetical protein
MNQAKHASFFFNGGQLHAAATAWTLALSNCDAPAEPRLLARLPPLQRGDGRDEPCRELRAAA